MKKSLLLSVFLAIFMLVGLTPASFAGSDRWIMTMTSDRMAQEKLIHVRFLQSDGTSLESDALKAMVIREKNCSSGQTLKMVKYYKMGFAPVTKMVGIYLFPQAWQGKHLCFSVSGMGKVEKSFTATDNNGLTIQLNMAP